MVSTGVQHEHARGGDSGGGGQRRTPQQRWTAVPCWRRNPRVTAGGVMYAGSLVLPVLSHPRDVYKLQMAVS